MARRIAAKILILGAIAAAGYYAYVHMMPHGAAPAGGGAGQGAGSPVSVAEVIERDVQQWNEYSGRLTAVEQAEIRPQVSGVIESVHFTDGSLVNKGDLLFVIDPRPYEAALEAANARAVLAESDLQRASALLKDKAIAQRDYDQRKNNAAVAKADLARAKLDLGYTQIRSPIDGRAGRAEITRGNLVEAGGSAPVLTTVVTSTPVYADFEIDEASYLRYAHDDVTGAQSGDIPVLLELEGGAGEPRQGRVESFDNRLNTASGTIRVRAVFDNPDGLLVPGLFARIKLGDPHATKAILITDSAIGTDQNKKFVYVVGEDNKAEYREIKLGALADGLRIVSDGLKPGEKIVVNGLQRVHPGAPVTPEVVPMEKKASASDGGNPDEKAPEKPADEPKGGDDKQ